MKKIPVIMSLLLATSSLSAQVIDAVDSIDVENGVVYYADSTQVTDTISCDTLDLSEQPIPQIPFEELDSLTMSSVDDRYVVVYKDGKCGIYDLRKEENVTRIEYSYLRFSFRKEMEGEYYTYFFWEEETTQGVIGIAEVNNQFISIAMPKKDEDNTE
jgi:hypothetical protein